MKWRYKFSQRMRDAGQNTETRGRIVSDLGLKGKAARHETVKHGTVLPSACCRSARR